MCDERERLIGYVYGECDPAERLAIDEHLAECFTCRREISGLKRVRQDLLAWDVPASEPVWRPVPAERPRSVWQQLPAWAMAAAAGLVLAAGAAGGAVTSAWLGHPAPAPAPAVAQAAPPVVQPAALVSPADLDALEQKVLARVRTEMDDRMRLVAAHTTAAPQAGTTTEVNAEINALRRNQSESLRAVYADILNLAQNQRSLEQRNNFVLTSFGGPALPAEPAGR